MENKKEEEEAVQGKQESEVQPAENAPKKSGGLFASVNPFSKKKDVDDEATAPPSAQKSSETTTESVVLPPNHLGDDVPEGLSTDLADPNTAPGALSPQTTETMPENTKAAGDSLSNDASQSSEPSGARRGTIGENLDKIPTAGGVPVGAKAMEERRQSVDVRGKSLDSKSREFGSDDPASRALTEANTRHNTGPVAEAPVASSAGIDTARNNSVDAEDDADDEEDGDEKGKGRRRDLVKNKLKSVFHKS